MIENLVLANLHFERSKNNLYLKLFKLEQSNSQTLKYHWSNQKKLKEDFDYTKHFYRKVIRFLSLELNSKHKINYTLKQWEIILGPWLIKFIEIYFDRYESVNSIKKKVKVNVVDCSYFNPAPKDCQNFINLYYSKEWNYFISTEIIKDLNKKNFVTIKKNQKLKNQNYKIKKKPYLFSLLNLFKNEKILIQSTGLKKYNLIKLFMFMNIFPYKNYVLEINPLYPKFKKIDRSLNLNNFDFKNKFEKIFIKNLKKHIPINFLEGFSYHLDLARSLNYYPKNIITSQLHLNSDIFKIWVSLPEMKKSNLYIWSHGGRDLVQNSNGLNHELRICKKIFGLKKNRNKKIIDSPRPYLINYLQNKFKKKILLIDLERSPFNILNFGPTSMMIKQSVLKTIELSKKIIACHQLKNDFKIVPYKNQGYNTHHYYKKILGNDFVAKPKTMFQEYKKAKIVICRYPLTAYIESFFSAPTLLYVPEKWHFSQEFKKKLPMLKKNKLVFIDSEDLLNHLQKINEDPEKWWESASVEKAKNEIINMIYKENTIKKFSEIILNQINK